MLLRTPTEGSTVLVHRFRRGSGEGQGRVWDHRTGWCYQTRVGSQEEQLSIDSLRTSADSRAGAGGSQGQAPPDRVDQNHVGVIGASTGARGVPGGQPLGGPPRGASLSQSAMSGAGALASSALSQDQDGAVAIAQAASRTGAAARSSQPAGRGGDRPQPGLGESHPIIGPNHTTVALGATQHAWFAAKM